MTTPIAPITILLADDDADDRLLTRDAVAESRGATILRTVCDGEDLLNYLQHRGPYQDHATAPLPDLILLDLSMPGKSGFEALAEIKATAGLKHIPVVILTTSNQDEEIRQCYDLGASSFVTKPVCFDSFVQVMKSIDRYWFETVELPS
jgi:CheY-like chemotaxis protein